MAETVQSQIQRSFDQNLVEGSQSASTASEFYSLLDAVDSEFIADQFDIGTYTNKHDFENHLKVGIFEGINPSDSLAELAEKTAVYDQLEEMAASTYSRHTNDRDSARSFVSSSNCFTRPSSITNALFNASASNGLTEQSSLSTEQISLSPDRLLSQANYMTTNPSPRSSQATAALNST